jgi:outer membrane protein assembly factor BamB
MTRTRLIATVLAVAALTVLAGCIKLPSTAKGSDSGSGGSDDFKWRGSATLPGGKVPVTTPRLQVALGDPSAPGLDAWTPPFDAMPKAFDIDGDGTDEIIALGNDTNVYVFDLATGGVLAKLPITLRPDWYIERVLNGVEAGILRPGEPASLVVASPAAHIAVWQFVPSSSTADTFVFTKVWEKRLNQCNPQPSMDAKPTLADLDGDGTLEILAQTEEVGVFAFRADGTSLWRQCWAGGNAAPLAEDLDGDGKLEAIFAADDGYLAVLDGAKGAVKWTFDATELGITPASISTTPVVAELDGVSPKEIVFTARNAPSSSPSEFSNNHMAIVAVHASEATNWEGRALWSVKPEWANPLSYTRLIARDVDDDGKTDIFGMDWNTIGHNPGNWERLGDAHVFRLDQEGNTVWMKPIDSWWSNKDIALADVNGDGELDVLANGPYVGSDGFWVLSAASGDLKSFLPVGGWKVLRGPQLLDLRHDGKVELVVPVEPVDPADHRGAILVVDLGVKFDPSWAGAA